MAARSQLGGAAEPRGLSLFDGMNILMGFRNTVGESCQITYPAIDSVGVRWPTLNMLAEVMNSLLPGYREYVYSRYVRDDARHLWNYLRRNGLLLLKNPLYIKRLSPRVAAQTLRALAAFRDYLRLLGLGELAQRLDVYVRNLRKIMPRQRRIKILEYEVEESIIEQAVNEVLKFRKGLLWRVLALIAFYTGLRSTEILFMIGNWDRLRKIEHNGIVIVELGYERKSKKAWITMFPSKLVPLIEKVKNERIGMNVFKDMRDKKGFKISILRKAHLAILSNTMQQHEIDLLQGRVSAITVRYYTRHLRLIAEKYFEAYRRYLSLASEMFSSEQMVLES